MKLIPAGSYWVPEWPAPANVRAVSTLRSGGASAGPYAGFNLATHVGDDPANVAANRAKLRRDLSLDNEPCWLGQVHGETVIEARPSALPLRADASVSDQKNQACAILTADCLPVLFCSRQGDRVGAAHAGWRGLAAGILDRTVDALDVPSNELLVWLGPAISQGAFEVGEDVRSAFIARHAEATEAFVPNARGRWQCDLYALAKQTLTRLGIREIYGGGACTFSDPDRFFSYRRDGRCGRMATLVWLQ